MSVGKYAYCAPGESEQILKINSTDDSFDYIDFPYSPTTLPAYIGCAAIGSNVYCAPNEASKVMKIDTTTDSVSILQEDLGNGTHK